MFIKKLLVFLAGSLVIASDAQENIAGGQDAYKGQFPWIVSVEATNFVESWPLCTGILITEEWVLTAAHCLDSEKPEWLWVVSGDHDTELEEGTEQRLLINSLVQHPDYTYWETPYQNDVGLIRLQTPAIIDEYTSLAPFPTVGADDFVGPCQEAGWGVTQEGAAGATILQWASVPLLNSETCDTAYSSGPDDNTLCAGDISGGVGACVGDNGGGLLCYSEKSEGDVIAGVMSWREGCAQPGKPAIYMNVDKYRDWILSVINRP